MVMTAESQEDCLWEEVLLSDDLPDSGDFDDALADFDVAVQAPEDFDHA
jgi:hypothetical protein